MHHDREHWGRHERHGAPRGGFGPFGGRGFGGGPGRGGRGFGGGAFRVGKMLADGDLRLIVLALLESGPRHGYDIIKALEETSSGIYSPSPGVVYPTLTFLEEAGYATATTEGNKKVYAITDTGLAYLNENRETVDTVLNGIEKFGKKMARAREWWEGTARGGNRGEAPDRDIPGVVDELNDARRALKQAIAAGIEGPEDEQRRIAGILREAASAIREGAPKPGPVVDL
ncbi:MAG: PadR family transcriptional regulator [Rhizobiales bacterium]|nr:PadR family transcriptional regulator [Hyphomicrobiales bacterium]